MFKSKKQVDPPLTMDQIAEDLETFSRKENTINTFQVLDDIRNLKQDDTMTLNQWWDCFEVKHKQMSELAQLNERLEHMKSDIKTNELSELSEQRSALIKEIQDNLKRLNEHRTPK